MTYLLNDYDNTAPTNLTDEVLLVESISNPHLFSIMIDRYQEAFMRAAYSIVRQKEEAEDIVQEAFTKIYIHAGSFKKQEGASFKSWAYRIVINAAISRYRKLKRIRDTEAPLDPEIYDNLAGKEHNMKRTEERLFTKELLEQLPEDMRRIVEGHYLEGKPYAVLANEEAVPLSTLKMRLFRAKKQLKQFIN